MRWIFNPPVWLLVPLALLVAGLFLWVFFPPSHSRRKPVNHSASEVIAPIPVQHKVQALPPPIPANAPDAFMAPETAAPADVMVGDSGAESRPSDTAVMVLETVGEQPARSASPKPAPHPSQYFLRVNQMFDSERDATDYAEDVLSEHGVEDCQIGVAGQGGRQRFVLLVGPFQSKSEAGQWPKVG